MVKKGTTAGHRRSARISALEERAHILAVQRQTKSFAGCLSLPPAAFRKRGRKCKSLHAVVINSVTNSLHQEGEDLKHVDSGAKSEQMENFLSLQRMPSKQTLEFILDILQRRDTQEIFAQPVDPQEVVGYYDIIKEPMDFGTMRAKLQEGMYTSLQQFERDVFLISSNAMKFNSSTTVYYTEGRAISELAQRLFHSLRTEPENFQLEYTRTRRRPGRKAQGEAGGSYTRVAKSGSLNDSSLKRTTQTFRGQYHRKPYIGHMNNGYSSGSRDGRNLNSSETDKRRTYKPQTLCSENENIVSAVYKAPKSLAQVTSAGTFYADSLMRFVEDLGPTAQMVANKRLGKHPIESPKSLPWTPARLGLAADFSAPKPATLQNTSYLDGGIDSKMPCNFLSNPSASYKGKMVCTDGQMNSFWRECIPKNNCRGVGPDTTNNGVIDCTLMGEKGANSSRNTDALGSSKEKTNSTIGNMDLLIATLMQISNIQNRSQYTPSGTYYPLTGYEDLPPIAPYHKINNLSYRCLLNHSEPKSLPYSSTSKAAATSLCPYGEGMNSASLTSFDQNYMAKAVHSMGWKQLNRDEPTVAASTALDHNYNTKNVQTVVWKQPNGQGPSTAVPVALDQNYMAKSTQAVQTVAWNQPNREGPSTAALVALDQNNVAKSIQAVQKLGWKQPNGERPITGALVPQEQNHVVESTTQAVQTVGWKQPNGEGLSNSAPATSGQKYVVKSDQTVQREEWKQLAMWGLPAICDLPVLHPPVNEQMHLLQRQSQVVSTPEIPLINTMNLLEGADFPGHQSEISSQCLWYTRPSSLTDNKLPDLDLQL